MRSKIKTITITLFLIDAILLIINNEYKDPFASVIPDFNNAKHLFYLGILCFGLYLIMAKWKEELTILMVIAMVFFGISLFFNLRLAKDNYDRIQCNNGISEYYQYFEYESCEKIKNRFEEDLINGKLKYFQDKYESDWEFEERLRDEYGIQLIGISCTQFTSMECYNNLVKDYIKQR